MSKIFIFLLTLIISGCTTTSSTIRSNTQIKSEQELVDNNKTDSIPIKNPSFGLASDMDKDSPEHKLFMLYMAKSEAKKYSDTADVYRRQEKYRKAIKYYTKAIKINPNDYALYMDRGVANYELGRYGNACEDFASSLAAPNCTDKSDRDFILLLYEDARQRQEEKRQAILSAIGTVAVVATAATAAAVGYNNQSVNSYSGSSSSYKSSSSSRSSKNSATTTNSNKQKCAYCNGTGVIIKDSPTFGNDYAPEYCKICEKYFPKGTHAHVKCHHCLGKGYK